jgi:hypothetical protein
MQQQVFRREMLKFSEHVHNYNFQKDVHKRAEGILYETWPHSTQTGKIEMFRRGKGQAGVHSVGAVSDLISRRT